jgi:hypothetical protein
MHNQIEATKNERKLEGSELKKSMKYSVLSRAPRKARIWLVVGVAVFTILTFLLNSDIHLIDQQSQKYQSVQGCNFLFYLLSLFTQKVREAKKKLINVISIKIK